MDDSTKTELENQIRNIVTELLPSATFRTMYGGTVIELSKDDPKSRIGGIFSYKDYVSLEFTKGANMKDPNKVLEGKGKLRRHIKLHSVGDIDVKCCSDFLREALLHN